MKIQIKALSNSINPIFDYCRKLMEEGVVDPKEPLEAYRGEVMCIKIRSIEEGSLMYIKDTKEGTPTVRAINPVEKPVRKSLKV